jgi:hypothetical protein
MTNEEIRNKALHALDWAKGSWGQGQYDKAPHEVDTMAKIWYQIAEIAKERAEGYDCK